MNREVTGPSFNRTTVENILRNHYAIGANRTALPAKAEAVERTGRRAVSNAASDLVSGKTPRKVNRSLSQNATFREALFGGGGRLRTVLTDARQLLARQ